MTKQNILNKIYSHYVSDVIAISDILLEELHFEDTPIFKVARRFRQRPDLFRNIQFLSKFILVVLEDYPDVVINIYESPKVSPLWLTSLLTFNNFFYECKENN